MVSNQHHFFPLCFSPFSSGSFLWNAQISGFLDSRSHEITFYFLSDGTKHMIWITILTYVTTETLNQIRISLQQKFEAKRGTRDWRTGKEDVPQPIQNLVCLSVVGKTVFPLCVNQWHVFFSPLPAQLQRRARTFLNSRSLWVYSL